MKSLTRKICLQKGAYPGFRLEGSYRELTISSNCCMGMLLCFVYVLGFIVVAFVVLFFDTFC